VSVSPGVGTTASPATKAALKRFRSPQTVIGRFVARRTVRGAAFLALVFGVFVAAKSIGYAVAYPTAAGRIGLTSSLSNNIGFSALFGRPHAIATVAGFTVWNTLNGMMIIGSIWAFLLATKTFRGEEDAGRFEVLLAGQTTPPRAAGNVLAGLATSLLVLYGIVSVAFILIGRVHSVDFSVGAALFFGLAAVMPATMFMAIGAVASQLMPTRSRAASTTAAIFGLCFLLRATADTTSAHWLLNVSPLGWVEQLQPLYGPQPLWLLPIAALVILLSAATIILAGRRDLGASTFADKDTAKPRTALLGSPLLLGIRLIRASSSSWLLAISFMAAFFGLLTKSAAKAFADSIAAEHIFSRLTHASQTLGATSFLGVVFFLLIALVMAYAASAVGAIREEEATGYLDNLLVRPISRWRWLAGRIALIIAVIILAGFLGGFWSWVGESSQQAGVPLHTLLLAGINMMAPALLTLGVGVAALGLLPRLTTIFAYAVIGWSFLIELVSSGLNLSHWVLDTSVFYHIALAPAADPKWGTDAIMAAIGLGLCLIGALAFNRRDLESE
jgi:polyether ionophore transport system permease protein